MGDAGDHCLQLCVIIDPNGTISKLDHVADVLKIDLLPWYLSQGASGRARNPSPPLDAASSRRVISKTNVRQKILRHITLEKGEENAKKSKGGKLTKSDSGIKVTQKPLIF
jgi:hypothetical protein